jgi:hypothetical protein
MAKLVALDLSPDDKKLKHFGFIALFAFALLAALAWYERGMFSSLGEHKALIATALIAAGGLSALLSLAWPRGNRPLYVGLVVVSYPIGYVMSYVLLGLLFFGVIAPIGALMRALGKDPLERRYDKNAKTYWSDARPARPKSDYFRQF